ncbi:DUF507 family protein [Pseudenhygromyxa sp. WMMC2535]|uniref:DUF507 family protein n=1 Tax=Pseudenhygromyxa sp. WMMC2535 TaxID=2712867 RepID=UPI0015961B0F|nr:DUF507 family protein [Pseudenhygromyxa sp. WMMC2535]NVB41902.1 DUF507 family protein [Pseudenhygromyxa sp. WMMC2535]
MQASAYARSQAMRLYASKIPAIVDSVIRALVDSGDLETSNKEEFSSDVESVLREYLRTNREITERSKDILEARGLPYSELHRIRRQQADQLDFGIGEEAITWISNQLLELFMRSHWVEEIYVEDSALRRKLKDILRRNMQHDDDLDREVKRHLKHLQQGTDTFEIEYQKQLEMVKRKHGLT